MNPSSHRPASRSSRALLAVVLVASLVAVPNLATAESIRADASGVGYHYWTASAQEKVYPSSRVPSDARPVGNASVPPILVGAAQAEYEGIQLAMRAWGDDITDVWIESSNLVMDDGSGLETIAAENAEVFKVDYVDVEHASYPYSRTGLEPDPLIPMTLENGERLGWRPWGASATTAFRRVKRDTTQPFYVLFHVPTDAEPGTYWGALTVTCRGQGGAAVPTLEIPVILDVFPFSVEQRTLATSFGLHMSWAMVANSADGSWLRQDASPPADADRVPERTNYKADQQGAWLRYMAEHRISPQMMLPAWDGGSNWAPPDDDGDMVARDAVLQDYLGTGTATTFGGERFGFSDVKMPEYGAPSYIKDPFASSSYTRLARQYYQTMYSELGAYQSRAYAYPIDEPTASQRGLVERYARWIDDIVPDLEFMVTTDPVTMGYRLLDDVDIYGHKLHFFYRDIPRWIDPIRDSGGDVWIYSHATTWQGEVPMFLVDKPLAESRVQGWFAYHSRAEGLLHFSINAWRPSPGVSTYRDPYQDPLSYRKTTGGVPIYANGDGSLVYPGYYPSKGLVLQGSGPVGSLRMEALRDGLEDYEYLKLLQAKSGRSAADALVARVIGSPETVVSAGRPTFPGYSKTAIDYHAARNAVARALGAESAWSSVPPAAAGAAPADPDAWEAGAGDDTWLAATDLTDQIPNLPLGQVSLDPLGVGHTLDTGGVGGMDEDWFSFDLGPEQVAMGVNVRIEALADEADVDPVIEIYGPGPVVATPPAALPEALSPDGSPSGRTATDPNAIVGVDDGAWYDDRQASATLEIAPDTPGAVGTYYVRVRQYYQGDFGQASPPIGPGGSGAYTLRARNGQLQRLAGPDRYRTAVAVSRERYSTGSLAGGALVVATGASFPDALSGSTLAGAVGGPVLLTSPTSLPGSVKSEIRRLGVGTVYVLGGTSAVSNGVVSAIDAITGVTSVVRISGSNRYRTAYEVARRADRDSAAGVASTAFVVSGLNFPDALAASPVAAGNVAPILLTRPDALDGNALAAIRALGITDVVIVGGTAVVGPAVESALAREVGSSHVRRLAGSNRYDTARRFAAWATELGESSVDGRIGTSGAPTALGALLQRDSAGFASGENFPDALAGGVVCGHAGAPVLLVPRDEVPSAVWASYFGGAFTRDYGVFGKSYLFGGSVAVDDPTYFQLDALTNWIGVDTAP